MYPSVTVQKCRDQDDESLATIEAAEVEEVLNHDDDGNIVLVWTVSKMRREFYELLLLEYEKVRTWLFQRQHDFFF